MYTAVMLINNISILGFDKKQFKEITAKINNIVMNTYSYKNI